MKVPAWIKNPNGPTTLWRTPVGWSLVGIGVLGIVLPVIPGLSLLAARLLVLSARYRWAAICLQRSSVGREEFPLLDGRKSRMAGRAGWQEEQDGKKTG
jgi:hypothetical protein